MKTNTTSLFRTNETPRSRALKPWLTTLVAGFAATSLMAATVTIYTNDFESYTEVATSLADEATDADVTGPEWNVSDDNPTGAAAGSGVQVINWTARSGSKSLLIRSASEAQIHLPGPLSGSRYQFDFWLYVHKGTGDRNFYIIPQGEGNDNNGSDFIAYRSDRGTAYSIWYYDGVDTGVGWVNTGVSHIEDTWQHHRMIVDPNALKMDLYIDDMNTPVLAGVDLARSDVPVPTRILIRHEGNSADDGYFAIDDISLTVDDAVDLTTTFTEGFETYPARVNISDDADPLGPWITTETVGTGTGKALAPERVQVVDSTVVTPRSGTKCLKLEGGQRAGATIAWGVPPQQDVQITWWARVPASVQGTTANYLRMSLYGAEDGNHYAGDNALLGYGSRDGTTGDATSLTYYNGGWFDSGIDYTPDTWEQYRLTTHTGQGLYTIIKNPNSPNPQVIVDRLPFIGGTVSWNPVFMAAWSSSNGSDHPPVYIDDIEVKSLVSVAEPFGPPYTPTIHGTRFTNFTQVVTGGALGRPVVDPRDNTTILFAVDATPPAGGIYRARKVASGNWAVDPTPIVAGLDRPSGLAITADGTLWWTHDYNNDYTRSVGRLKEPWASSTVETVIADIVDPTPSEQDDDAIDLCVAPAGFTGSIGQPGWIVVADRGVNGNARNGVYVIDPATMELNHTNYSNFLVHPTSGDLGDNLNAITALPASGEVATLSEDGTLVAINASGVLRYINAFTLWPIGGANAAEALAADPVTGKIWGADDLRDEVWSIDATTGLEERELSFPLTDPTRPDRQMDFHDPGMAFAPNGDFLVVSDTSTANGGGRLIIFHNEVIALPTFSVSSVARGAGGVELKWDSAGGAKYDVLRGTDIANAASFQAIATDLTTTTFTDADAPTGAAFYRVVAKP